MPEWLWVIIVGSVSLGLLKLIYGIQSQEVDKLKIWKESYPMKEEVLTKSSHASICRENLEDVKNLIIENKEAVKDQIESIKEYFDLKIERDILVELRRLNGK